MFGIECIFRCAIIGKETKFKHPISNIQCQPLSNLKTFNEPKKQDGLPICV